MDGEAPHLVYDPVCGMRINPVESNINADFKGHKVYFCAKSCRDKFLADPHRFLKPKGWWRRYLDRMARSNTKTFGGKGPSCCG